MLESIVGLMTRLVFMQQQLQGTTTHHVKWRFQARDHRKKKDILNFTPL